MSSNFAVLEIVAPATLLAMNWIGVVSLMGAAQGSMNFVQMLTRVSGRLSWGREAPTFRPVFQLVSLTLILPGVLAILSAAASTQTSPLRISVRPDPVYIERTRGAQLVNCDFIVENASKETWTLREVEVSVYDRAGKLQTRKFLNDNGNSPSIETLNRREAPSEGRVLIFNPLFSFANEVQLFRLHYRFVWRSADGNREALTQVDLKPRLYRSRQTLRLPLRGRVLVWDGHDYYAHHRRFDYLSPHSQESGTRSNPDRYGHDLVPINADGDMFHGDPGVNKNWLGFGQAIYAAGSGRVVAAVDDSPDNREVDEARFAVNKLADYGNYIVVDHGGGEFALYGHIQQGSARVKAGDRIRAGHRIAAVGASGSSLMPHLHFQLQTAADTEGEGLPSYFGHFDRLLGSRVSSVPSGPIDSGDIVSESK